MGTELDESQSSDMGTQNAAIVKTSALKNSLDDISDGLQKLRCVAHLDRAVDFSWNFQLLEAP
uniref:Uncharacterized protein n=1 Tax=Oryza barthii TaxID=65489 RepID=A0A0D3F3V6_9ORYZ